MKPFEIGGEWFDPMGPFEASPTNQNIQMTHPFKCPIFK